MKNKFIFIATGAIGALLGSILSLIIASREYDGSLRAVFEVVKAYFMPATGGMGYSAIFELLIGLTAGAYLLTLLAIIILSFSRVKSLAKIYQTFDLDSKYLVSQRRRETLFIGVFLFLAGLAVLYIFSSLHGSETGALDRQYTTVKYPLITVGSALAFLFVCLVGSLSAFYAVLTYGRFKCIPIVLTDSVIQFFRCFYRLPIIAIDQSVSATLEDADIDFKSQGGKSLLVIANDLENRVIVSPKLDFINGSFDELVDTVEKFAIPDDD